MHFTVEGSRKTLLFFTILTSWTIAFGDSGGDRILNLRLGFDLTQGKNGVPTLRLRNIEDSAESSRYAKAAQESNEYNDKPAIRADSFSEEKLGQQVESSREGNADPQSSDDQDSDSNLRYKSTKGIAPDEYASEETTKLYGRNHEDDDGSNDEESKIILNFRK